MGKKVRISVLMIAKNAEKTINKSLVSIKDLASEIIIVDGGSTDATIDIARKFKAKIFYYQGSNWGHQCQIGLEKVTGDWVLVLDSDEVVTKELSNEIKLKIDPPAGGWKLKIKGYYIPFQSHYLGRTLKYGGEDYKKMILFKNKSAFVKKTPLVHYYYQMKKGKVGQLKNKILHYSYLSIFQTYRKFTNYGIRIAKQKYLSGEKSSLKKIFFYPPHMFWARFIKDKGYKDGIFRIPLDLGFAYMEFLSYFLLLFKTRQRNFLSHESLSHARRRGPSRK